ncbi:hypothetical protein PHYBOEH_005572 [Phytophthora boehmeriae]|uniref:Uncharacterized protein n=1 Tax=Phytophthora boehmeriae TaxID=109152 RepID=A0A8T1WPA6_9STRA|nr:hypothetical protein PHYBOEH_005572 [Phytophthora boehmeriae]
MAESNSAVLSTKRVASGVAEYIWSSPCLKPLVFNPFIVSVLLLIIIWTIDFMYGKTFAKRKGQSIAAATVQHVLTTYIIVATGVAMNNIIIKHHYRLRKAARSSEPLVTSYSSELESDE